MSARRQKRRSRRWPLQMRAVDRTCDEQRGQMQ